MGVTTAVGGNCGINEYDPVEYLNIVDRDGAPVNVAMLAGHEYFRRKAGAVDKYAPATEEQKTALVDGVQAALKGGCMGLSFGLRYVPGINEDEFHRCAVCCQPQKKLITAHVRDDADYIFESVAEVAEAGEKFGLPVQISHIGSMGGFGQMEALLRQVDGYRLNGLDISMDCYPYCAFSTEIGATTYDDGWMERYRCDYSVLEFSEGKYKGQRANAETFAEMRRDCPEYLTVCHVMKAEDIDCAYRHPGVMVASDGILDHGQGHPRAAGTFPRFFAEYVRTGKVSMYAAIEKMTAQPAARLGLANKGRLNAGADADMVIFDPEHIADRATFAEPMLAPVGIDRVLISGKTAAKNCEIVSGREGRAIRG